MYPLNVKKVEGDRLGFAVANDEAEHQALTDLCYEPAFIAQEARPQDVDASGHTLDSVRTQLDAAGIAYDKRLGLQKLIALLPA